ncbi:hypothetical protein RJT34_27952 [Clitoria ternatea]|uniref:Uncharacterized protein n=1 Tax=Clitoria ternatea TaxID=43366 RepID=A0AAN9FAJ0_CLITE
MKKQEEEEEEKKEEDERKRGTNQPQNPRVRIKLLLPDSDREGETFRLTGAEKDAKKQPLSLFHAPHPQNE